MNPLNGVGATRPLGPGSVKAATRSGRAFELSNSTATAGAAQVAEASLLGLLALQEAGGDAVQDRAARRFGFDLLAELSALQRDLLTADPDPARLRRLADLADAVPEAADPGLRDAVAAIVTRARIEAARYGGS